MQIARSIFVRLAIILCIVNCLDYTIFAQTQGYNQLTNTWGDGDNNEEDKDYCLNRRRLGELIPKHRADSLCYIYADSMYNEAMARNDRKGCVMALSHKALIHINYTHNIDSMSIWTDSVKSYAKQHKLPRYYYSIWSQYIAALFESDYDKIKAKGEIDRMLEESMADNYVVGQIECYRRLASFYEFFNMHNRAYDMHIRGVRLTEEYDSDNENLAIYYAEAAQACINIGKYDEAEAYLAKGDKCAHGDADRIQLLKSRIDMAVSQDDGERVIELAPLALDFDIIESYKHIQLSMMYYHIMKGEYATANNISNELYERQYISESAHLSHIMMIGKYDKSNAFLRKNLNSIYRYRNVLDSLTQMKIQLIMDDESMKLDISSLERENSDMRDKTDILMRHFLWAVVIGAILITCLMIYYTSVLRKRNKELKESEAALRIEKDTAERANEMKEDIIRNMSHEIRTPLNAIVGFSEILTQRFQGDVMERELTDKVRQSSNELLSIVNTVIELSNLDTTPIVKKNDTVDINELCAIVLEPYMAKKSSKICVRFNTPKESPIIVTNRHCLEIALDALISNAFKFTPKGIVEIAISQNENNVIITIEDSGVGISNEDIPHLFERFFKADQFTQGIGLGLPLCQTALKRINASVSIAQDKENSGTIVTITIPIS